MEVNGRLLQTVLFRFSFQDVTQCVNLRWRWFFDIEVTVDADMDALPTVHILLIASGGLFTISSSLAELSACGDLVIVTEIKTQRTLKIPLRPVVFIVGLKLIHITLVRYGAVMEHDGCWFHTRIASAPNGAEGHAPRTPDFLLALPAWRVR